MILQQWYNNILPKDGSRIIIRKDYKITLNIDSTPRLKEIYIFGELVIDSSKSITVIMI